MKMQASMTKLRVLIGEDNPDFLQHTHNLLSGDFDVVATAENGLRLVAAAEKFKPDIVVTDIGMPELTGIEASWRILELGCCKAIVALSVEHSPEVVKTAFEAGIRGYVLKEEAGKELVGAVYAVAEGGMFLSSGIDF
jgi:DNA-binding NarL/FixJ family response regulator